MWFLLLAVYDDGYVDVNVNGDVTTFPPPAAGDDNASGEAPEAS